MSLFIRRFLGSVILLFLAFLAIALITYSENDPSWLKAVDHPIENATGFYGAYIADPIMQSLGFAALLPGLCFISYATQLTFVGRAPKYMLLRFSALIINTLLFATFLGLLGANSDSLYSYEGIGAGGFIGYYIGSGLGVEYGIKSIVRYSCALSFILFAFSVGLSLHQCVRGVASIFGSIMGCYRVLVKRLFKLDSTADGSMFGIAAHKGLREHDARYSTLEKSEDRSSLSNIAKAMRLNNKNADFPMVDFQQLKLPPIELLHLPSIQKSHVSHVELQNNAKALLRVLDDFGISGVILHIHPGPVVTLYEFEPAAGVKTSRIIGLSDDIARSMSTSSARISVVPNKNAIGIELPNHNRELVFLREVIESDSYQSAQYKLPLVLGKGIDGGTIIYDLVKMPHLLIAGTTGSGKSVAVNTMILSLLYKRTPEECRLIMIDPKMLELSVYEGIPHLLAPVVTDPKKAILALKWVVKEMDSRYRAMSILGVRNIEGYNNIIRESKRCSKEIEKQVQTGFDSYNGKPTFEAISIKREVLPYIVVIVDEMADLMLVAGKDIEIYIQRLAQMARAAGIHLIMATQRPSVDVITGVIKANFPTRISFQVTSKIDSRTILGEQGAEQLLGMGDMLHMMPGGKIERVHGPFVGDKEVESVVDFFKEQSSPQYLADFVLEMEDNLEGALPGMDSEDLYAQAVKIVLQDKRATTSYLQRCFKIGYNKAASLIEKMEKDGIISAPSHTGKREILDK